MTTLDVFQNKSKLFSGITRENLSFFVFLSQDESFSSNAQAANNIKDESYRFNT
ncbi:hypothetical protein IX307_002608 [Bacteroides pyogenes]|nr:hypothetical protein [Bacteroides pyogenes]MBR8726569.1 hypothetical protein [Bacteroides pyogenes]MBR8739949.1 hypothetical protein [Bacteroides pyogenes]MBR8755715.1 hypothetical protein [Bacteroides pyogenes]MBR8788261.1 hypothetical protein [Bacteroides pyogenes]